MSLKGITSVGRKPSAGRGKKANPVKKKPIISKKRKASTHAKTPASKKAKKLLVGRKASEKKTIVESCFVFCVGKTHPRGNGGWEAQAVDLAKKLLATNNNNTKRGAVDIRFERVGLCPIEKTNNKKKDFLLKDYGFVLGDEVMFGTPKGEQTSGVVKGMAKNTKTPKIRIESLQKRGVNVTRPKGSMFSIKPELVRKFGINIFSS